MSSVAELIAKRRIVVCVGSGGVGKTTSAATLALVAALQGRRVLVLTIDPARRLADALGLAALGHDIQRVPDEKLDGVAAHRGQPRTPGGRLDAMMLDQKRAFDEVVDRYARDPAVRARILKNAIYQQISASLAGSHEYAAMSKLCELAQKGDYDLFVLDTPPTENALDFLAAPQKITEAVDSEAIQWIMRPYLQRAGSLGLRFIGVGGSLVLRGLSRFLGSAFLDQMAEFFVEFSSVLVGFRERAKEVSELLRKPDVAFIVVCSPEPLSIEEALYFLGRLRSAAMPVGGLIVNRVHESGPEVPDDLLPLLTRRPELSGYVPDDQRAVADDLLRTYREQQVLAHTDAASIERLQRESATPGQAAPLPLRRVPMFEHDIHDVDGLAMVSRYLV